MDLCGVSQEARYRLLTVLTVEDIFAVQSRRLEVERLFS